MNENANPVCCPRCGGMNLTAMYDKEKDSKFARNPFHWGLLGLAVGMSKNKNKPYWQCQNCGFTFLMNTK